MAPFWNDARRCLVVCGRCSAVLLPVAVLTLLAGIFDAPWVLLLALILVSAVLVLASGVLTLRANRLFRSENRDGR